NLILMKEINDNPSEVPPDEKRCLSFGQITPLLLYPLFLIISSFYSKNLEYMLLKFECKKDENKIYLMDNQIVLYFIYNVFYLLSGIVPIIKEKLLQNKKEDHSSSHIRRSYNSNSEAKRKYSYLHILALVLFQKLMLICLYILSYSKQKAPEDIFKLSESLFLIFLAYFIYNLTISKHRFISLIVIIICNILTQIIGSLYTKDVQYSFDLCFRIFYYFASSFVFAYQKFILTEKYFYPHSLVFFEGFFNIIFLGVLILMFSFIPCGNLGNYSSFKFCENNKYLVNLHLFFDVVKEQMPLSIIHIIFYGILQYVNEILGVFVLLHFNPIFRTMPELFLILLKFIYNLVEGDFYEQNTSCWWIIIIFILDAISFFFVLVFLELLILRFWGLDEKAKGTVVEDNTTVIEPIKDEVDEEIETLHIISTSLCSKGTYE
ncbi:MAG: hypothetical protein MJ252_18560, partial [archaeon]|nr:hypothetical protein [archaeon]